MPSDITGAPIFDMKTQEFRFHPGPVFTQFLLADAQCAQLLLIGERHDGDKARVVHRVHESDTQTVRGNCHFLERRQPAVDFERHGGGRACVQHRKKCRGEKNSAHNQ